MTRRKGGGQTISDVARRAGVSPMTVSRVINGESNVREETRAKVSEAIRALGYTPNLAARSLAGAQTVRVGLLYSNPSAAYLSEFLLGSLDQCSRSAVQMIVEKCDDDADQAAIVEKLSASVDGVILPPPLSDASAVVEGLRLAGVPTVLVASGKPPPRASAIRIDDFSAAEAMTRHLLELGHRRIGFIKGHPNQTASAMRFEGYAAALGAAGIALDTSLVAQGFFTYHSGLTATETLLDAEIPPTAIFASNDDMAAAATAIAHRRLLDVPQDLTVTGFDDTAFATTVWPPLTTIRQPVAEMSKRAVLLLLEVVRLHAEGRQDEAIHEVMAYDLIRRNSDAPPKARTTRAKRGA